MTAIARRLRLIDHYGLLSTFGFCLSIVGGLATLCLAIGIACVLGGRAYGRTTCANWSDETGIATKFAVLNWADSGSCLAHTPDGRWVLNSHWQAFVSGSSK